MHSHREKTMSQKVVPLLVDEAWPKAHPGVLVADIRWSPKGLPGIEKYRQGHIPGAVYVDLESDLSAEHRKGPAGRHPLPEAGHVARLLARLGIAPDTQVVAYD